MDNGSLRANIVDAAARTITCATIHWKAGVITAVESQGPERSNTSYLIPGFVDAHVHIESSMLIPSEFGRQAVCHGTVAAVADPHEIANVLGVEGVRFMLNNARQAPCKLFFGVPSCVPATPFETAGAALDIQDMEKLFAEPRVVALAEMMNYPGVLDAEPAVMARLQLARKLGYPIDGHAPGLRGEAARRYAAAGIRTDHECFTLAEAEDKLAAGMSIQIREGSAARNFTALHPLIRSHPDKVMLCSDDKHPDDLLAGHIDRLAARAVAEGHDVFNVLRCACCNPVRHYRLPVGQLQPGDAMDAVLVSDLQTFRPLRTWVNGKLVAEDGVCRTERVTVKPINRFHARPINTDDLAVDAFSENLRVIKAVDGDLVTHELHLPPNIVDGRIEPDTARDILMLVVLNRYRPIAPSVAFVRGFGLQRGAIASSVAHDSHNIIAVGCSRAEIVRAVNGLVETTGGIALADRNLLEVLPLPMAGLMSIDDGTAVAQRYTAIDRAAKALGSPLRAPYMTLSFMALLVIPSLKLSDRGLFDGERFTFVPLRVSGLT